MKKQNILHLEPANDGLQPHTFGEFLATFALFGIPMIIVGLEILK